MYHLNLASWIDAKGCRGYLVSIKDTEQEESKLEDILIANECLDVFLNDLPRLPPNRKIECTIDLVPGLGPISKVPYPMTPAKLKELKDQLQDLLNKDFI